MTTQHPTPRTQHPLVPELGPSLGRLTALPEAAVGAPPRPRTELADLRLALVGRVFELAALARRAADAEGATAIFSPDRLRAEWERGAAQVAERTLARIADLMARSGAASGIPPRLLRRATPTAEEAALLKARLLGAGVPFIDGLSALDVAEAGSDEWREAALASARRLETAWLELEQRGLAEEGAWQGEVARVATWRPSPWPRRIFAAVLVMGLAYVGLVLGGFLPVPPGGTAFAEWWWRMEP